MKTSTVEVQCDFCHAVIPPLSSKAIRTKIQFVGKHLMGDFCNRFCLTWWVRVDLAMVENDLVNRERAG